MVTSITPEIESVAALSEFTTCVGGHMFVQLSMVSSLGRLKRPTGQSEQESVSTNGRVPSGDDMYLLAGQQPYLAVLDPRDVNAFLSPSSDSHLLPHNVRLNPLSLNTADHKNKIGKIKRTEKNIFTVMYVPVRTCTQREKKKRTTLVCIDNNKWTKTRRTKSKRIEINCGYALLFMVVTLETTHFETSELNNLLFSNK